MFHLPQDVINKIYEYDPTKKSHFDKVAHQLHMRQVWYEVTRYTLYPAEKWILRFGAQQFMTEEMFEDHVMCEKRWHRIHGKKPRLLFHEHDLLVKILGI